MEAIPTLKILLVRSSPTLASLITALYILKTKLTTLNELLLLLLCVFRHHSWFQVGESGVGKTCITNAFEKDGAFDDTVAPTVFLALKYRVVTAADGQQYKITMWGTHTAQHSNARQQTCRNGFLTHSFFFLLSLLLLLRPRPRHCWPGALRRAEPRVLPARARGPDCVRHHVTRFVRPRGALGGRDHGPLRGRRGGRAHARRQQARPRGRARRILCRGRRDGARARHALH